MNNWKKLSNIHGNIRRMIKKRRFKKGAILEADIQVGSRSNCVNFSSKKENIHIGAACEIQGVVATMENGKITIGAHSFIGQDSVIGAVDEIKIGRYAIISNHVHLYDNNNHPTDPDTRIEMCKSGFYNEKWGWKYAEHEPIIIEDNVWIGEYSAVMKGVKIGKGAVIGAHSVVTRDIPPYSIAAGNPAKVVKELPHNGKH